MNPLLEAVKMAEIRLSLLNLLLNLSEEAAYSKEDAVEDLKAIIWEIDSVPYTI